MVLGPKIEEKVVPLTRYGIPLASGKSTARVPNMDIGERPTFKALNHWRMMYENYFFNSTVAVYKERDVCNILQCKQVNHGCFNRQGGASAHTLKSRLLPHHHVRLNQYTALSKFPKGVKPVFTNIHPETNKEQTEKPMAVSSAVVIEEKKTMPLPSVSLLRRPRMHGFNVVPVDIESDLVEGWCTWVYITLPDDAPYTPQSFYVKNYPLLLQKIKKRSTEEQAEQDDTTTWRPLSRTPDISMTFFDNFRLSSLSIDGVTSSNDVFAPTSPLSYHSSLSEVSLTELLSTSSSEPVPSFSSSSPLPSIPSIPPQQTNADTSEHQVVDPPIKCLLSGIVGTDKLEALNAPDF